MKSLFIDSYENLPLVSVCTPTFNRRPFIPAIIQCFLNQSYPANRIEWIVVDDGTDKVRDLFENANIPQLRYYEYDEKMTLGKKRNLMHTLTKGDIIVYMDDDDWYPRERIAHSVHTLLNSTALCAGSSEIYLYNTEKKQMYVLGPYGQNHATAGTFAFKRELLDITNYNESDAIAEEGAFLKQHTIPMVQMDPIHTILVFTHDHNSFDKRMLLGNVNNKVQIKNEKGEVEDKYLVRTSETPLDVFFTTDEEKQLMKFYVSLDILLGDYDLGMVKHKPDVVKQTHDILAERQMNTPFIPLLIDNKSATLSINQILSIIHDLQKRNIELTDMNTTLINRSLSTTDPNPPTHPSSELFSIQIPNSTQVKNITLEQVNRLIQLQHNKIADLTNKLSIQTNLDPQLLYMLDI